MAVPRLEHVKLRERASKDSALAISAKQSSYMMTTKGRDFKQQSFDASDLHKKLNYARSSQMRILPIGWNCVEKCMKFTSVHERIQVQKYENLRAIFEAVNASNENIFGL